jgi:hypothetical protein
MQLAPADILETVRREAELRAIVGENLNRLVALGRRAGISGAELARTSGLSKAAVAEIAIGAGGLRTLELAEVEVLLRGVAKVAIVAAGPFGYREYRTYGAYICQAARFFRAEMERFGFYADREVKPEFPKILDVADDVFFTQESADAFRAEGRELLARIVERVVADGVRNATEPHKVYALSTRDDEQHTLKLDGPIRHATSGPGTGFVQKQRYVSEQALEKQPKTTRELLELDGRGRRR